MPITLESLKVENDEITFKLTANTTAELENVKKALVSERRVVVAKPYQGGAIADTTISVPGYRQQFKPDTTGMKKITNDILSADSFRQCFEKFTGLLAKGSVAVQNPFLALEGGLSAAKFDEQHGVITLGLANQQALALPEQLKKTFVQHYANRLCARPDIFSDTETASADGLQYTYQVTNPKHVSTTHAIREEAKRTAAAIAKEMNLTGGITFP